VVEATQQHPVTGAVVGKAVETRAQIATQNGVSENDLDRANPRRNWKLLKPGMKVLVPAH
jgi:hypothetical protein